MRLPFLLDLNTEPRAGETPAEHIRRVAFSRVHPPWVAVRVLASYAIAQHERIESLERRVAALEAGRAN